MAPKRPKGTGAFPKPVESPVPHTLNPTELYAALALGTNSCRMLIAQPKGSQFHVVDSFSKSVQLGAGLEKYGRLHRGSMQRTIQALRVCQQTNLSAGAICISCAWIVHHLCIAGSGSADRPLSLRLCVPILQLSLGTMDINAPVISGSDPGAVPGGSTKFPFVGGC